MINKFSKRRKKLVDALAIMQDLAETTPETDVIGQVRKNLYQASVYSIKTELDAINGGQNGQLFAAEYQRAA